MKWIAFLPLFLMLMACSFERNANAIAYHQVIAAPCPERDNLLDYSPSVDVTCTTITHY